MALTHREIKFIRSLSRKKTRDGEGLFVAEGPKAVGDLMEGFRCAVLIGKADFIEAHPAMAGRAEEVRVVSGAQLEQVSLLQAPQDVAAIFRKPEGGDASVLQAPVEGLCLALDGVQDPGNVGTILRTADWFGLRTVFCSPDTADAFAPKVVQATMGALAHIRVVTTDLAALLEALPPDVPVYGTYLEGDNIWDAPLEGRGVIIMGNEGRGISAAVTPFVGRRLFIPPYPGDVLTGESLNVGVATGIVCAAFRAHHFFT